MLWLGSTMQTSFHNQHWLVRVSVHRVQWTAQRIALIQKASFDNIKGSLSSWKSYGVSAWCRRLSCNVHWSSNSQEHGTPNCEEQKIWSDRMTVVALQVNPSCFVQNGWMPQIVHAFVRKTITKFNCMTEYRQIQIIYWNSLSKPYPFISHPRFNFCVGRLAWERGIWKPTCYQRDPIWRPETKLPSSLLKTLNAASVSSNIRSFCAEFEFRSWFLVSTVATSSSANCSWKVCPKGISRRQNLERHCCAKMMYGWLLVWMRMMYCTCFSLSDSHSIRAERGVTLWTCCVGAYTESLVKQLRKSNH